MQGEIAERLLDRLEDCKRSFPVAAVLGGSGGAVLERLHGGRAGIQEILYLDPSRHMLAQVKKRQEVSSWHCPCIHLWLSCSANVCVLLCKQASAYYAQTVLGQAIQND